MPNKTFREWARTFCHDKHPLAHFLTRNPVVLHAIMLYRFRIKVLGIDPGWKNLAFCVFDRTASAITIQKWELINLFPDDAVTKPPAKKKQKRAQPDAKSKTKRKRPKTKPLEQCNIRLQAMLQRQKWESGVQLIAIETQPGGPRGNNTSRCISHCIQSYMLHFAERRASIGFVHPITKRNFFSKDLQTTIKTIQNKRKRYKKTKVGAQEIVEAWMQGDIPMPLGWPPLRIGEALRHRFESSKKKDDLADSFLLGLLLLRKHEGEYRRKSSAARGRSRRAVPTEATAKSC